MTNDEIAKLEGDARYCANVGGDEFGADPYEILALVEHLRQAAARIEALEAENARLRAALKPFATSKRVFGGKMADAEPGMPDGHAYDLVWNMDEGRCDFTLGQFRRARAALARKEPT